MTNVFQNTSGLHPKVAKYGCGILCVCWLDDKEWSLEQINDLYKRAVTSKAISEDCFIKWEFFLRLVNSGMRFVAFEKPSYKAEPGEHEIQQWHKNETDIYHFLVGDGDKVLYDPTPNSLSRREGILVSKRILVMRKA